MSLIDQLTVRQHLDQSIDHARWIHEHLDGAKIPAMPTSRRHQLAGATLHVAVEHHQAIVLLLDEGLFSSAFALMRCQFEAYVRGAWLGTVATEADVERADRDKFPSFEVMVNALEDGDALPKNSVTKVKNDSWKVLNSLTHTGEAQRNNRLTVEGLGHRYSDQQIHQALHSANSIAYFVTLEFARLGENVELRDSVNARVIATFSA